MQQKPQWCLCIKTSSESICRYYILHIHCVMSSWCLWHPPDANVMPGSWKGTTCSPWQKDDFKCQKVLLTNNERGGQSVGKGKYISEDVWKGTRKDFFHFLWVSQVEVVYKGTPHLSDTILAQRLGSHLLRTKWRKRGKYWVAIGSNSPLSGIT